MYLYFLLLIIFKKNVQTGRHFYNIKYLKLDYYKINEYIKEKMNIYA